MTNLNSIFTNRLRAGMTTLALILWHNLLTAQCPTLVWADEFSGSSLDLNKWTPQTGDGCSISQDLCGWGNNEQQWYLAQNATVSNGTLKITAKKELAGARSYSSARLRTINKGDWTYGRFEARIKLPVGRGLWPAFWMLSTNEPYGAWPQSGEIDIMENIGSEPAKVVGNMFFGNAFPDVQSRQSNYELFQGAFNDDFHVFAVEWEADRIRWYVDGFLYSTKTKSDVGGYRWPFDKPFHILLNVAVGGNFPGNPNSATPFPQTMEVDYVRVYNGYFPSMSGQRLAPNRGKNTSYSVNNAAAGATFNWTVPAGATLVSGQGTSRITVDWGDSGGPVSVTVTDACGARQLETQVTVEAGFVPLLALENFDDPGLITFSQATGMLTEVANPGPNSVNGSPLCGRYLRNGAQQYDVLAYKTAALGNADVFITRNKKFYIDIYTNAPVGTQILLQLENSSRATPANYPNSRHSRFEVRTTKQNAWERLEFSVLDQPDRSTNGSTVDQLIFLFASNSFSSNTYHWDNFQVYSPGSTTGLFRPVDATAALTLFPNPATDRLVVQAPAPLRYLLLTDLTGRVLRQYPEDPADRREIEVSDLPAGAYLLRGTSRDGRVSTGRFVKAR